MTAFAQPQPIPPFARRNPEANCLKTGTVADIPRVPEDFLAVNTRTLGWYNDLKPQNLFHAWMIDQMAVTSVRIDHNSRIERRLRDRAVLHAEQFWDVDRRLQAETLGGQDRGQPPDGRPAAPADPSRVRLDDRPVVEPGQARRPPTRQVGPRPRPRSPSTSSASAPRTASAIPAR